MIELHRIDAHLMAMVPGNLPAQIKTDNADIQFVPCDSFEHRAQVLRALTQEIAIPLFEDVEDVEVSRRQRMS